MVKRENVTWFGRQNATQRGTRAFVVFDTILGEKRVRSFLALEMEELETVEAVGIMSGERAKSLEQMSSLWDSMAESGLTRNDLVVGVGGGTITDLVAFAAATFKRGVPCILVPTTVVAMVDAVHGGKTGLNWNGVKNQIGSFTPAAAIAIDTKWLDTLPRRELLSGWMEMVKHSLLAGKTNWADIKEVDSVSLNEVSGRILESVEIKRSIVRDDPYEGGARKQLNLGHTVGHALESCSYEKGNPISHGIAVGWGLITALHWSVLMAGADAELAQAIGRHIARWLPSFPPFSAEEIWPWMQHDKKNEAGEVRVVCLQEIGRLTWDVPLDIETFTISWQKTEETCRENAGIRP
jgi:3-dehydroquinate synthase